MSDKLRESVSAIMDGEGDDLELRRVLTSADRPEVRAAWRDYHLQREALTGGDMRFADVDISRGVWAAIAKEQQQRQAPAPTPERRSWLRPLASLAVAASVAAVVVVGMGGMGGDDVTAGTPSLADVEPAALPMAPTAVATAPATALPGEQPGLVEGVPVAAPVAGAITVSAGDEVARRQLDRYLDGHTERAVSGNGQGLIGFARVPQQQAE